MNTINKSGQNERTMQIIKYVVAAVLFVVALVAIIVGQKNIGPSGLCLMLVGLAILIFLLYMYNRKYR